MRTCVIANPVAGQGRVRRLWPRLAPRLRAAAPDLTVRWTAAPGEATALTRTALEAGVDRIVMVGGDGTFHEVVNGFVGTDGRPLVPSARLVPLPCGTGNDFRRALGLPDGLTAAGLLARDRLRTVDLLRVEYVAPDGAARTRVALNEASFGLSGRVLQLLDRGPRLLPGRALRYLGALLRALVTARPVPVALTLDGTPLPPTAVRLVAVANGPAFGDGIRIAPTAVPTDGRLDVTVINDRPLRAFLWHLPRFYRGTHLAVDGVSAFRGRRLTARPAGSAPVWLEADGELLGHLPARIEVLPDVLPLQC
jgi:YegS/Rv2252/BmrU family lipid kinase